MVAEAVPVEVAAQVGPALPPEQVARAVRPVVVVQADWRVGLVAVGPSAVKVGPAAGLLRFPEVEQEVP